jgi:cytochrome-b5 reductase
VHYMLSQPPAEGSAEAFAGMLTGHVDEQCISLTLPKPDKDVLVYVCGPPGFMQAVSGGKTPDKQQGEVSGAMKAQGYTEDMVFKF